LYDQRSLVSEAVIRTLPHDVPASARTRTTRRAVNIVRCVLSVSECLTRAKPFREISRWRVYWRNSASDDPSTHDRRAACGRHLVRSDFDCALRAHVLGADAGFKDRIGAALHRQAIVSRDHAAARTSNSRRRRASVRPYWRAAFICRAHGRHAGRHHSRGVWCGPDASTTRSRPIDIG
jgi:hypothetical protein